MRQLHVLTIVMLGFTFAGLAKAEVVDHPLPLKQCSRATCTSQQAGIWAKFEAAGELKPEALGKVYSGGCYHRTSQLDPNQEHFAVIFLEVVEDKVYMSGKFAFYYTSNPYSSWTPSEAIAQLQPKHKEIEQVHAENGYSWVDEDPKQSPILQYYLRQNANEILLYGEWGADWNLFCELTANSPPSP